MVLKFNGKIFGQIFPIFFVKPAAWVNYVSEVTDKALNSSAAVFRCVLDILVDEIQSF